MLKGYDHMKRPFMAGEILLPVDDNNYLRGKCANIYHKKMPRKSNDNITSALKDEMTLKT
jgi:hypothetical protein